MCIFVLRFLKVPLYIRIPFSKKNLLKRPLVYIPFFSLNTAQMNLCLKIPDDKTSYLRITALWTKDKDKISIKNIWKLKFSDTLYYDKSIIFYLRALTLLDKIR